MKPKSINLNDIKFPDCYKGCGLVKILGVSECESVYPHKFDKDGKPIEIKETK